MKRALNIAGKILSYSFFLLGAIILFFNLGDKNRAFIAFFSFAASLFFYWVLIKKNVSHPEFYWVLVNLALWANFLGEFAFYYGEMIYYDKFLHFFTGLVITAIVYDYYKNNLEVKHDMIFFGVLGMLAFWEIYEYIMVVLFNYPFMGVSSNGLQIMPPLDDTMYDLIWGSIGSILFLIISNLEIQFSKKKP